MTGSLEDSIAQLLVRADEFVYLTRETAMEADEDPFAVPVAALVEDLAEALRAASVVPAEPPTHDTPDPKAIIQSIINEAEGFHRDDYPVLGDEWFLSRLRLAVAAVDGEAPAT